jgi:hypothetical protein
MDKYLKAIKNNICSICVDSTDKGKCTLNKEEICAVEQFLPQIVEVVHKVNSDYIDDYYKSLKDVVCKNCRTQEENGNCFLREDSNCSLDRYFSSIVEIIKKVDLGKI